MISFSGFDDVIKIFDNLNDDLRMLSKLETDPRFLADLKVILSENFDEIWSSQGGAIGENWKGNDLIDSGELKASFKSGNIEVTVTADGITFGTSVNYAKYVNEKYRFMGITGSTDEKIAQLVIKYLQTYGKTNWS